MKIVFLMREAGLLRHYEETVRVLLARGHNIHFAFSAVDEVEGGRLIRERLSREFSGASFGAFPEREETTWVVFARVVRLFMDYLRYFHPKYNNCPALRQRIKAKVPKSVLRFFDLIITRSGWRPAALISFLRFVERISPCDPTVRRWIDELAPDVLLVTPLVNFGSEQVEALKCANQAGVRTGLCVASWDNLTNKGLIRFSPDRVFVWNDFQKQEAVEFHDIASSRIRVTGAQTFDDWFDWKPSLPREDFCKQVGLDAKQPFLLYLCSSKFIAPNEAKFIQKWLGRVRSASGRLKDVGVLIRPHPKNAAQWASDDLTHFTNVAVWPRGGEGAFDQASKSWYYDSLYHSCAAVGINTTAQIEAGIVGRPVFTLLAPEFQWTQQGTLHFDYLTSAAGGVLTVSRTFEEHLDQLADVVANGGIHRERCQAFVRSFVRPNGLDKACSPALASEIEALATLSVPRRAWGGLGGVTRVLLVPVAVFFARLWMVGRKKYRSLAAALLFPGPEVAWVPSVLEFIAQWHLKWLVFAAQAKHGVDRWTGGRLKA